MIERLIECATCSRHVKSCDAACPFCQAPMRAKPPTTRAPYARLTAGAAVAASVATVVACTTYVQAPTFGRPPEPEDASLPSEDGGFFVPPPSGVVFYGLASFDASLRPPRDAATDANQDAAIADAADDAATADAADDAATDGDTVDDADGD
jgi:hypothetical protein